MIHILKFDSRIHRRTLSYQRKGRDQVSIGYQRRTKRAFADHAFSYLTGQFRMTHEWMSRIVPNCSMCRSQSILKDFCCDQIQDPLTLIGSVQLSYQTMSHQHQCSLWGSNGTSLIGLGPPRLSECSKEVPSPWPRVISNVLIKFRQS